MQQGEAPSERCGPLGTGEEQRKGCRLEREEEDAEGSPRRVAGVAGVTGSRTAHVSPSRAWRTEPTRQRRRSTGLPPLPARAAGPSAPRAFLPEDAARSECRRQRLLGQPRRRLWVTVFTTCSGSGRLA